MKKICFVVNNISQVGGVQRVVSVLLNELSKLKKYQVSILLTGPKNTSRNIVYPLSPDVNVIIDDELTWKRYSQLSQRILSKIQNKISYTSDPKLLQKIFYPQKRVALFQKFFEENKFDIIVGVTPQLSGLVSLLNVNSVKIGWFHNTYSRYFKLKGSVLRNTSVLFEKLLPKLDKLVVLSDYDKKKYDEKFDIISKRIYNPASFESDKKSNLSSNNIIFVGRLYNQTKGLDLLIEVLVELKKKISCFNITIVGDGPDRSKFLEVAKDQNIRENITFVGFKDNVIDYYTKSSVLVLPSRVEGFGLVVVEAMECGVPVVSFETEGPSEIIENNINGYLVEKYNTEEFAHKIEDVLKNQSRRIKMGKQASKRAENFAGKKIAKEWDKLINNFFEY